MLGVFKLGLFKSIEDAFYKKLGRIAWGIIKGKFRKKFYSIFPFLKPAEQKKKEHEPGYDTDPRRRPRSKNL